MANTDTQDLTIRLVDAATGDVEMEEVAHGNLGNYRTTLDFIRDGIDIYLFDGTPVPHDAEPLAQRVGGRWTYPAAGRGWILMTDYGCHYETEDGTGDLASIDTATVYATHTEAEKARRDLIDALSGTEWEGSPDMGIVIVDLSRLIAEVDRIAR